MKKTLFLTCFVLIIFSTSAQYKPFQLGFKASPTIGWLNANDAGLKSQGTSFGFNGGFIAEIKFTENYMFLTGINYDYSQGKVSYQGIHETLDTLSFFYNHICDINQIIKFQYIELPLSIKLKTNEFGNVSIFGHMGLNTAFCFNAKSDKTLTLNEEVKKIEKEDVKNNFTLLKESLILGVGTEIGIDNSSFLSIGINFNTALNNIAKFNYYNENIEKKAKLTHSYFELQIAFFF